MYGRRIFSEQDMRSVKLYSLVISVFSLLTVYFIIQGPLKLSERLKSSPAGEFSSARSQSSVTSLPLKFRGNVPVEILSAYFVDHVRKLLQNDSSRTTTSGALLQSDVTVTSPDLTWKDMLVSQDPGSINSPVFESSMPNVYTGRQDTNWSLLYQNRRANIMEACQKLNTSQKQQFEIGRMQAAALLVDRKHSILYCPIAKVGSTFWKRTLAVMASSKKYISPFELKPAEVRQIKLEELIEYSTDDQLDSFMNNAMTFMFVRDPYSRLYSAYINKLYSPNYHYWRNLGARIIRAARRGASLNERTYGHNVTFTEFLRFTLKLSELHYQIDPHFAPMHKRCDPCRMPYHFIGKLETFKTDAIYLLDHWKQDFSDFNISFSDFEMETALDTAVGHVEFLFDTWSKAKNIDYPFYNLVLRVWSSLQIRGLLSKDIPLPFTESDTDTLTRSSLVDAIKQAFSMSVDRAALVAQREEAMVQAYRTVPMVYLHQLKEYVAKDCQLFGYDNSPSNIFNRSSIVVSDHWYMQGI